MNQTTDSEADVRAARQWLEASDYEVLAGWIPLSTGYSTAMDGGKSCTETPYKTLNEKAEKLAQAITDKLAALSAEQPEEQTA